jgi:hypothetical protein
VNSIRSSFCFGSPASVHELRNPPRRQEEELARSSQATILIEPHPWNATVVAENQELMLCLRFLQKPNILGNRRKLRWGKSSPVDKTVVLRIAHNLFIL